jgi:flagellar FliL protein
VTEEAQMSTKEKEAATDEAAPPKKSRKKLILIVLAAVFLLGGGAGGYLMLTGGSGEKEAPPPPEPGVVLPLDAVTINLADGHYLKVKLALQATVDAGEELDGSKALDVAISHFSELKMAELSTAEGRDKVKHELVEKVGEAYEGEIIDIYYTEFVMQ